GCVRLKKRRNLGVRELWTPVCMVHHTAAVYRIACQNGPPVTGSSWALSIDLVPHLDRGANCSTRIAGRRLHVHPLERRLPRYFAVRPGIHGAAAGQLQAVEPVLVVEVGHEVKERLFVHGLRRPCDIAMPVSERLVLAPRGPEQLLKCRRKQGPDVRAAALPG